jgi:hypothetical protein
VQVVIGCEIIHLEGDVGILAAVVIRLRAAPVPGKLELERRAVVHHERTGPEPICRTDLPHDMESQGQLIEPDRLLTVEDVCAAMDKACLHAASFLMQCASPLLLEAAYQPRYIEQKYRLISAKWLSTSGIARLPELQTA